MPVKGEKCFCLRLVRSAPKQMKCSTTPARDYASWCSQVISSFVMADAGKSVIGIYWAHNPFTTDHATLELCCVINFLSNYKGKK